jgi:hypothetical protein
MQFVEVANTSAAVAEVSGRLGKIGRLADLLARLAPEEIEPAVAFLSGGTRQGRVGLGHAAISTAAGVTALSVRLRISRERGQRARGSACSAICSVAPPDSSRISCAACCTASCARER